MQRSLRVAPLLLSFITNVALAQSCSITLQQFQSKYKTPQLTKTTGDGYLDQKMNEELSVLSSTYHVVPGFFMYDDNDSGPNAQAINEGLQQGTDYTVIFGMGEMTQQLASTGPGNYTVAGIMAHEFTHLAQYARHSHLSVMGSELQADFMAGWYIANRNRFNPAAGPAVAQTLISFFNQGDYDFTNPDHHGTREERAASVKAGVQNANMTFDQAYAASQNLFRNVGRGQTSGNAGVHHNQTLTGDRGLGESGESSGLEKSFARVINVMESDRLFTLRGPKNEDEFVEQEWIGNIMLPEAKSCVVEDVSAYHCIFDLADGPSAIDFGNKLSDMVTSLGGKLSNRPSTSAKSIHAVYKSERGLMISISVHRSIPKPYVDLIIYSKTASE